MAPPSQQDLARAVAYRESILAKVEANKPLTCAEKRFFLRTGKLAYKALAFPESLTPAQRNRLRYSPPPEEVTANILKASNGKLSTPSELYAKVLRDPGSLNSDELTLITRNLYLPASLQEALARRKWQNKTSGSKAWNLAFNRVTTEEEAQAHRAAVAEQRRPEREAEKEREYKERVGPLETGEQREGYHANERRLVEEAGERLRAWEEWDRVFEGEVKVEMGRMADGMGEGECECCGEGEGEGEEE